METTILSPLEALVMGGLAIFWLACFVYFCYNESDEKRKNNKD